MYSIKFILNKDYENGELSFTLLDWNDNYFSNLFSRAGKKGFIFNLKNNKVISNSSWYNSYVDFSKITFQFSECAKYGIDFSGNNNLLRIPLQKDTLNKKISLNFSHLFTRKLNKEELDLMHYNIIKALKGISSFKFGDS